MLNEVELEKLKEKCINKSVEFEKMLSSNQYRFFLELEHIYEELYEELNEHKIEKAIKKIKPC